MSTSTAASKDVFNRLLREFVDPFILSCGFGRTRKLQRFQQWHGDCLWTLNCAFRMEKNRDEGWVFVSVCVGFRSLDQFLQSFAELGGVDPKQPCAMGTDTSHLREGPPFPSIQWRLLPNSNPESIAAAVIDEIKTYAFPYFERFGTLEKCISAWERGVFFNAGLPHGDSYLAAAYWLRGERQRACNHVRRRLEYWQGICNVDRRHSYVITIEQYERFLAFLERQSAGRTTEK